MERTTRLIAVIGALALLAAHLVIGRAWSGMAMTATMLGVVAAVAVRWRPAALALPIAMSCLLPPLVWFSLETFAVQYWVLWLAALLGAMLPHLLTTGWQAPRSFRGPLILATLAIVVSTPIVVLRELDFNFALLGDLPGAVLSGLPWFSSEWILQVALTSIVGVLWFDWLCGQPGVDLERHVLVPFTLSIGASCLVAMFQMFVDVTFLNETVYGGIGRAAGTMFDANVSGVLAACAIGFAFFLAAPGGPAAWWLALVPIALTAVWASGSRTGVAATLVILLTSAWTWWRSASRARASRWLPVAALVLLVVAVIAVAQVADTTTVGPLRRFARMLPQAGGLSPGAALAELWNRNGYGEAATWLIGRYPLAGIGIGSFHLFGPRLSPTGVLPPDNAQNWLRHQVVELGVLGACGWLLFAAAFGWFLLRPWRGADTRLQHLRGVALAFVVVSLFGMPTQEAVPALVFWTTAAVLVRWRGETPSPGNGVGRTALIVIALLTTAFAVVTWQNAETRLRVPARARQFGWPFEYGFYVPEGDGAEGRERWMAERATALVPVRGPVMRLAVRAPLSKPGSEPVHLRAWVEGRRVLDRVLSSEKTTTVDVRMPVGQSQAILDLQVNRTVRPHDLDPASADERPLGALVAWTFTATAAP